jgi:methionine-rich copper-binding protein CopC
MVIWHIAMQASSIDIMTAGVMPCIRIIERIMVLHMSAQFMQAVAHDIICVEHTVHACSQAEQASIQACMTAMSMPSMPGIDIMSFDMAPIIIASIRRFLPSPGRRADPPPCGHARPRPSRIEGPIRLDRVMSQTIHTRRTGRLRAAVTALALAAAAVLVTASPALAHDALIGSDPADGSTVAALPAQVTLTFSAEIADDPGASEMQVTDASGTSLADGAPSVSDNVLTQPLTGQASGVVTVLWKVVSSDGHPTSGQFTFTVAGAAEPTPTESATSIPTETAGPAPTPTQTFTPGPPMESESTDAPAWPWIIAGLVAAAVLGAIVYLLVSRARREKALDEGATGAADQGSGPGSDSPADH